jgi:hypothetical protein
MKLKTALCIWFAFASLALGAESWEGTYRWDNERQQDKLGGVAKYVTLRVSVEQDGKIVLSCEILWKPGMDADFGAVVERSAVSDRTLGDGTIAKLFPSGLKVAMTTRVTGKSKSVHHRPQ